MAHLLSNLLDNIKTNVSQLRNKQETMEEDLIYAGILMEHDCFLLAYMHILYCISFLFIHFYYFYSIRSNHCKAPPDQLFGWGAI